MATPEVLHKWLASGWLPIAIFGGVLVAVLVGARVDEAHKKAEFAEFKRIHTPQIVDFALRLNPHLRQMTLESVGLEERSESSPVLYFSGADGSRKSYWVGLNRGGKDITGFHDLELSSRHWQTGPERALAESGYTKDWAVALARKRLKDIGWEAGPNVQELTTYLSGPYRAADSKLVGVQVTFTGNPADKPDPLRVVVGVDIATTEVFELQRFR